MTELDPKTQEQFGEFFRAWSEASQGLERAYHDLTGQVASLRAELALKNEELALKTKLASMGEMAARIAHELRNPLGSIELFASMLKQDLEGDPEKLNNAEHILLGVRSLNRIVSNLLLYTRFNMPKVRPCDVKDIVDEALDFSLILSRRTGVNVVREQATDRTLLQGDPDLLRQVFMNLITNALDAMPGGGALTLGFHPGKNGGAGKDLEVRISDTGAGMAPETVARIFDPFFTTKEGGMGLGLAIVREIVEAHRGRVDVQSLPEQGSTFSVVLPRD
ncbi:MAG: hypothetical protein HYT87_16530 [Nitrospirae bacterium]|nr:hypothetical protein [Nitrospirota bacterium]